MRQTKLRSQTYIVSEASKLTYNELHFDIAASRYDIATKGLSLGQDKKWKAKLLSLVKSETASVICDLACGTGDITKGLAKLFPQASVLGIDISRQMLRKAQELTEDTNVTFFRCNMQSLPLETESVDLVTGSYALRNAPNTHDTIAEVGRVLKPGGLSIFLDFAVSDRLRIALIQRQVMSAWGRFWGLLLHGNPEIHGYIATSLRNHPPFRTLDRVFSENKLTLTNRQFFMCGMVALSTYRKNG